MDAATWERAKALFSAALEHPAAARAAWLHEQCGGDRALGDEVATLLAAHAVAEAEAPVDAAPRIGRYRILSLLGQGGFGTVHLAEQHEPVHRQVALKVLRQGMDSAQVIARFALEREALARMSHPNIAQIYDAGTTSAGMPFFALEFVDGLSLVAHCDRQRLRLADRLRLFIQVCRGVHHAHQKGVIHRDLKPSNVLVATIDGRPVPKIIDFGIAKAVAGLDGGATELPTGDGRCLGTPGYMSPEQASLDGGQVDVRTDVYALGILLHELLTGRLPHDPAAGRERGLLGYLQRVREVEPRRPSTTVTHQDVQVAAARGVTGRVLRQRLRGDLDWITLRALERDPARRYQSADDIAEELERHLRHEPVLAGPEGWGYRLAKFVRRHRVVAGSAVAIVLALVFGLAAALWQNGIARAALRDAIGHRLSAQAINLAGETPTLALLLAIQGAEHAPGEDADAALYAALGQHHEVRQAIVHDGVPYWSAVSADGTRRLSGDDSGLAICQDLTTGAITQRFDGHEARMTGVAIDHDGRRGASFDASGLLLVLDLERGGELARAQLPAAVADAAFLADGTVLTAAADGVLRRHAPDGAATVLLQLPAPLTSLGLAPDARSVAVLANDGELAVHDLVGGGRRLARRLPTTGKPLDFAATARLQFTADGGQLIGLAENGAFEVVDLTDPGRSWQPAPASFSFGYAGGADLLAFCRADATLGVADLATRAVRELPATQRPIVRMAMDPAGYTLVAAVHNQPVLRLFDPVLLRQLATVRGGSHALYGCTVSPDGEWIDALGHNGTAHRWRTAVLGEQRRLAQQFERHELQSAVALSPGDRAVTWRRADGASHYALVDVVRGVQITPLGEVRGRTAMVRLSPRQDAVIVDWTAGTVVLALPEGRPLFRGVDHLVQPRCNAGLTRLVGFGDGRVQAYDLRSGVKVWERASPGAQYADVSEDGGFVLTADGANNTTTIWSTSAGPTAPPVLVVQHSAFAFDARFTTDGRHVIAFANDTSARIVELATGRVVRTLRAPTGDFGWVHVDPTGRFVAVQTPEETSVHELGNGQRRLRWAPAEPGERIDEMVFAADGSHALVTMAGRRWRVLPLDPLAAARALAPRELTAGERLRYELPEQAASAPAVLASRVHVDAAITALDAPVVDRDGVRHAFAQLELATALRRRMLPRFHLARAMAWSRLVELDGGVLAPAGRAQALADVEAYRARGGDAAPRVLTTREALAALRQQPGFDPLVPGRAK